MTRCWFFPQFMFISLLRIGRFCRNLGWFSSRWLIVFIQFQVFINVSQMVRLLHFIFLFSLILSNQVFLICPNWNCLILLRIKIALKRETSVKSSIDNWLFWLTIIITIKKLTFNLCFWSYVLMRLILIVDLIKWIMSLIPRLLFSWVNLVWI